MTISRSEWILPVIGLLLIALVMFIFGVSDSAAADSSVKHVWTTADILDVVTSTSQKVDSLSFESETVGRVASTPTGVYRRTRHNASIQAGNRSLESIHLHPGLGWDEDLDHSRHYLFDGELTVLLFRKRIGERTSKLASPEHNPKVLTIYNDLYLDCIGWAPSGASRRDDGARPTDYLNTINELLQSEGVFVQSPNELVNDRDCVLVSSKNGNDRIWLDMQLEGAAIQRHQRLENDGLFIVVSNADFREMAEGVWLPWRVTRTIHRGPSAGIMPQGERDIFATATRTIRTMELNTCVRDDFIATLPPGTIMVDHDSGRQSFQPGGEQLLDEMIHIAGKMAGAGHRPGLLQTRPVLWSVGLLVIFAIAAVGYKVRGSASGWHAGGKA